MNEIHLQTTASTNTYAKLNCKDFPSDEITCIYADEQTKGRGRFQRSWSSPKGVNLYVTFYFTLPINTLNLSSLSQMMACTLTQVLEKEGLNPKIKWPNDIQLNGKKLAGILCETEIAKETIHLFLGVGINVNMKKEDLETIDQPATSIMEETKKTQDLKSLLQSLQKQFKSNLKIFKEKGFRPFFKKLDSLLILKNEQIRIFDGKKLWEGTFHSLTEDGQLMLKLKDNSTVRISSGDIKP